MTLQEIQDRNKQIAIMLGAATKQMMGANAWVLEEDELNLSFDVFNEKLFSNNGGSGWKIKDLKFHSDWNWLHEGVAKMYSLLEPSSEAKQDMIHRVGRNQKEQAFILLSNFAKLYNEGKL